MAWLRINVLVVNLEKSHATLINRHSPLENKYKFNIDSYVIVLSPLNLSLCLAFKLTKTTAQKLSFLLIISLLNANCSPENCKFVQIYKIINWKLILLRLLQTASPPTTIHHHPPPLKINPPPTTTTQNKSTTPSPPKINPPKLTVTQNKSTTTHHHLKYMQHHPPLSKIYPPPPIITQNICTPTHHHPKYTHYHPPLPIIYPPSIKLKP